MMTSRSLLRAACALIILAAAPAAAAPLMAAKPAIGASAMTEMPIVSVQAGDPRVTALEEQIRVLTGQIEEMNFMLLQMQEQMRKAQEDMEYRIQEIEDRRSEAGGERDSEVASAAPRGDRVAAVEQITPGPVASSEGALERGAPPVDLGTITFDAQGNPTGGTVAHREVLPGVELPQAQPQGTPDGTVVAALPPSSSADELYSNAYNFILSGDYATAEAGFREHIERFPEDPRTPDAHYWLGEAQLGMKQYRGAAETFLAASRDFPESRKAPEMLLKLGVSLAALNQRDVACSTYAEIGRRYQNLSPALQDRVRQEQALSGCS